MQSSTFNRKRLLQLLHFTRGVGEEAEERPGHGNGINLTYCLQCVGKVKWPVVVGACECQVVYSAVLYYYAESLFELFRGCSRFGRRHRHRRR